MTNRITTIYLCKDEPLQDITIQRLRKKYTELTIYDNGLVVRYTDGKVSHITTIPYTALSTLIEQEGSHLVIKNIPQEHVQKYTGRVKAIIILRKLHTEQGVRALAHKKLVDVNYL